MKEYVLSYYPDFKCIAEKCKHTCCAGWEMNIDSATLDVYKKHTSCFKQRLQSGINFKKSRFKSDKTGRCAFLTDNGLCDIIINLGEQSLCQVCRDHPRFRSYFENSVEMGLGFCCEQATKIILSYEKKIDVVLVSDDGNDLEPTFIQTQILNFRQKALDIIQDRSRDINDRLERLLSLCSASIRVGDFKKITRRLRAFERLEKAWLVRLKKLSKNGFSLKVDASNALYCEQFLVNSIYRHVSDAEDTMAVRNRVLSCIISWFIINGIFEMENQKQDVFALVCDVVRAYSAEVEYSQKNLEKLFELSSKFIKL